MPNSGKPRDCIDQNHVWDREQALARVNQREDRLAHLLSLFLDSAPNTLARICDSLRIEDRVELRKNAHALKGSAVCIGAAQVYSLCCILEAGALSGEQSELNKTIERLQAAFNTFKKFTRDDA